MTCKNVGDPFSFIRHLTNTKLLYLNNKLSESADVSLVGI